MGAVTFEKKYPDGIYHLRSVPSAGGLYPCEIYIQIRGVKGLLSGIYHYEPFSASITLLQEIDKDGVEHHFKTNQVQKGLVFLISSVYFRSSWKYKDRSIRYILLDSGHQLGSIYAALSVMGRESEFVFDFDKLSLNKEFGFRDDEMFTCIVKSSLTQDKEVLNLRQNLPFVSACDYLETNGFIEDAYKQSALYDDEEFSVTEFFNAVPKEQLKRAILERRSIRAFREQSIKKDEFEFVIKDILDFANANNIDIFYTTHLVEDTQLGLYKNTDLLSAGDFRQKSQYLALEQKLSGQSAVTFYFTSNDVTKYQKVNILSGFIAQIIYLKCELMGIGCSGIGAYYDDETKEFLGTKNNILYLLAIGR
jgi:SagB-type dehydrogenase family enzyme